MHEESMPCASNISVLRRTFYDKLEAVATAPLWSVMSRLVTPEPQSRCIAAKWKYESMRALLLEAGQLITASEAERRVLVLENPGIRGLSQITQSLYAGLQLILPGEIAPTHRHAAAALRFIMEGEGGYTAVDGERISMRPGDFILTPSWTFHDHGNLGREPVIWLDGLDVPIVNLFDASFAQTCSAGERQAITRVDGDSSVRFGANLVPVDYRPAGAASPVFHYPYARTRAVLGQLSANGAEDAWHGVKLQYINPVTGGYPLPTMAGFIQQLPAGFRGRVHRSTDATVYCVKEGFGSSQIGDASIEWQPGDVFVAPSWHPVSHQASEQAVLFSFSDRPAQKALGIWREELVGD